MFDKTFITESQAPIHNTTTIHENKAPTDDSIKLYEEVKEKAYESIIRSVKIEDNGLNGSMTVFRDLLSYSTRAAYRFTLNKKEYKGDFECDESFGLNTHDVLDKFIEKLSQSIALELMNMSMLGRDNTSVNILLKG